MPEPEQIVFFVLLGITGYLLFKRILFIRKAIKLGKPLDRSDQPAKRWERVFLIAFGQKKMFRRFVPAVFHFIIYAGFIIINIEVLEFTIDGLTGNHRTFAQILSTGIEDSTQYSILYNVIMNLFELLAFGVIIACVIFLVRRNILRINRFSGIEMRSWPKLDANLILIFEIVLMIAILLMNGSDQLLQENNIRGYINTGDLYISKFLVIPFINDLESSTLLIIERSAWWFHILGILAFAVYVTYSKHLHIILAFPNTYYASLKSPAEIPNMEVVNNEVKSMMGLPATPSDQEVPTLGAKDVTDLNWKNIMDAFTCTECGRCTSACPANITGKKLSPRKIMMDVRDRAEEMVHSGKKTDKSSLFDRITREELYACTTCNACIDVCPVSIDPVSIILEMRRYTVMEESSAPAEWNMMFNNIETNFAPWKFPAADRFKWAEELKK